MRRQCRKCAAAARRGNRGAAPSRAVRPRLPSRDVASVPGPVSGEGADGIYRYRCEVQVNHGIPRRFYVRHRYSDGAVALAAKVLAAASPAPQPDTTHDTKEQP